MEKVENKKDVSLNLPNGYDVVTEYKDNIEQNIVDNLIDYFGRVYYRTNNTKHTGKIRNNSISKYDNQILNYISKKTLILLAIFIPLFFLGVLGFVLISSLAGGDIGSINAHLVEVAGAGTAKFASLQGLVIAGFIFSSFFIIASVAVLIWIGVWGYRRLLQTERINDKVNQWNRNFDNFVSNLKFGGLMNTIQASTPDFVVDKHTPSYDRRIYNLHNRIYSYADIPQDARRLEYLNLLSGFYKGNAFSLSFSSWEWFREAKVIDQDIDANLSQMNINIKRNLKRFEDGICVLAVDTFVDPDLNFVLNNPDGKNIRLQNKIFNNIFSLAVNNPKNAYKVFTPYVQHTLSRLKTWSDASKCIRQVIKEGTKIYVIFDGSNGFFKFDRILKKELNYVFNTNKVKPNVIFQDEKTIKEVYNENKIKCGSLDESASLMVEYILEEFDLLYTALEMATCYPTDAVIDSMKKTNRSTTLKDVLEDKKRSTSGLADRTINELNSQFANNAIDLNQLDVNLSRRPPMFNAQRASLTSNLEKFTTTKKSPFDV